MQKNFVSYNSSAGSGKTFTLVKEYLKIALENDNPNNYRQILAITFTNKAAAEMKERVLSALKGLSGVEKLEGTPKFLMDELTKPKAEGGLEISAEKVIERSQKVFKSILHNYNDFGISTIDKFTHKIIRTFAHDLQLPLNFNIELDEKEVLKNAIDLLIAQVGNNEKLTKILVEYTIQKSDDEQSWKVETDLLKFSEKLLKGDSEQHLKNIRDLSIADFESIKDQLYQQTKAFENRVKEIGLAGLQFINEKGIEKESFSGSNFYNYWIYLSILKDFTPNATVTKIVSGLQNWYAQKVDASQKELIDTHKEELIDLFNQSRSYIDEFEERYLLNKLFIKNLYNIAVINEIEKTVLEFKKENNILNISDFNKQIAAIVSTEPIPFIYERLGEKYHHYLIDEFQDTSTVQWHNLLPLVDNSLASGNFNMVVGDAKQAIYRWRGGEVEQIIKFPKIYQHNNNPILLEREASIERNFKEENLATNYRSKAEIVDFNNQFFQSVATQLSENYIQLYNNLKQEFNPKNIGGGVEIKFFEDLKAEEYQFENLDAIMQIIEQSKLDGYPLKDIAILTRSRDAGKEVAVYLLENNVPVISSESLLLINSKEVTFLIAVLRYLAVPSDKNYQIKVLNYLTDYVYHEDLFEVLQHYKKGGLTNYLADKNINLNFGQLANYALYELLEQLIISFNFNTNTDIYVQFFLDKVHEYASKKDNSILNFLEWWDLKAHKFSVVIPDGIDAVQVMTVHKSKGLEFPVVIYPFADTAVKKGDDFFWTDDTGIEGLKSAIVPMQQDLLDTKFAHFYEAEMDKSKLDLINILYVALTRPKDRLYILSKKTKTDSKNGSVGDYLYNYCASKPDNKKVELVYRFGLFEPNKDKEEIPQENAQFMGAAYNNWRNKIKISYQAPKVWDTENPETIGEYGTLIHNILSKIENVDDLDKVLKTYLLKGMINEVELERIQIEIKQLFDVPSIYNLFTDFEELKNERSILLSSGETYQPDRVVVKNNKTFLVDYKTGERELKHTEQLTNYRNLLNQMGYKNIEASLLYLKEKELVVL